jgi:SAM-dependent methyltransferase
VESGKALAGVNTSVPNVARMYDYYLGGKDNFAADRAAAEKVLTAVPAVPTIARANRAFLGRAVRYLAGECGIRQFLDIGTGLPTANSVHQVAQTIDPACRVVYVDHDPVVLAHGRALLADNPTTTVIQGDLRDPEAILAHPELTALIDLDAPVAVLMLLMLHFLDNEDNPHAIVARLRDALPPGSYLAFTHGTWGKRAEATSAAADAYQRATAAVTLRTPEEISAIIDGFDLVEPGLVDLPAWRPDGPSLSLGPDARVLAGLARLRR